MSKKALLLREKARRSLLDFTRRTFAKPGGYRSNFHHEVITNALGAVARYQLSRLIIVTPPRQGKALAVGTPVLTRLRGFVPIEDLEIGEDVFGLDGKPTKVVAKSPIWKDRRVFEVTTNDGDRLVVDENHEWLVQTDRKADRWRVRETKTLVRKSAENRAWPVPLQSAVGLKGKPGPIDPWALGFWLGDGCSQHAGDLDYDWVRAEFERSGYETSDRATHGTFGVLGMQAQLRKLGLLDNKHIPEQYLFANKKARRALLQGLMDSDGYVPFEAQSEFTSTNRALAEGVQFLVRSLGARASFFEGRATLDGRDCGPKYRVRFDLEGCARLPRKAENSRNQTQRPRRYIRVRELEERLDTVCIEVDAEDHLFLAGESLVPTHNSELVSRNFPAWYIGNNPHRQVISATYGDALSQRMAADSRRIIASDAYKDIFPNFGYGDKNSTTEWNTTEGGSYYASGIRLPVTGMGANVLLVDDPVKNREEAESKVIRDKTKEAFDNDFLTRLEQPNAVVLMATRWHEEDLIGQTLNGPTAGDWVILHFPRVQDRAPSKADPRIEGAPLWPGRFLMPWERCDELVAWPNNCDAALLREAARHKLSIADELSIAKQVAKEFDPDDYEFDGIFEDNPGLAEAAKQPVALSVLVARDLAHYHAFEANDPYGASALEQGRPTPRGATFIDTDAINSYMGTPAERAMYCPELLISVDANFKKTTTSDFASLTVLGRTRSPNAIYPIDERHGRFTYPQLKRRIKELTDRWPRAAILIEAKANGQALIDELREAGLGRVIAFNPEQYGSKDTRAQYAAEFIAGGGLFVPSAANAPWIKPWLEEISKYGQTDHDDRMDSLSMACLYWGVEQRQSGLEGLRRIVALAH